MKQKSGPTDIQIRTEKRQDAELTKLRGIEAQKTAAAGRRTRGRASLISGSERGITSDTEQRQFAQANVATSEKLGVQRRETAQKQSLINTENQRTADSRKKKKAFESRTVETGRDALDPARGVVKRLGLLGAGW